MIYSRADCLQNLLSVFSLGTNHPSIEPFPNNVNVIQKRTSVCLESGELRLPWEHAVVLSEIDVKSFGRRAQDDVPLTRIFDISILCYVLGFGVNRRADTVCERTCERTLTNHHLCSLPFSTSISFLIRSPALIKSKKQKQTSVCLESGKLRLDPETPWEHAVVLSEIDVKSFGRRAQDDVPLTSNFWYLYYVLCAWFWS